PERDLVDPVGLADETVGQTERLEHLDRPAGDPVGLAHLEGTVSAIDDRGPDRREVGQLRGEYETGGAASDHEHIDLSGKSVNPLGNRRIRLLDQRVARLITVEVELHSFTGRDDCRVNASVLNHKFVSSLASGWAWMADRDDPSRTGGTAGSSLSARRVQTPRGCHRIHDSGH